MSAGTSPAPEQPWDSNPLGSIGSEVVLFRFAPKGPRTIEMRYLFADPFWKYLGFKSEDAVHAVLCSADAAGLPGKYIVADQLEQITTCLTRYDILARKVRL
jgi:hypothetical protein